MPIGTPTQPTPQVGASSTTVTTASFTPSANALLLVFGGGRGGAASAVSISDSLGGSWTEIDAGGSNAGIIFTNLWYQETGPSPAARTITVQSPGATQAICVPIEVTGDYDLDFTNFQSAVVASGDANATMNAYEANSIALTFYTSNAGSVVTSPTGFTEFFDANLATNFRVSAAFDVSSPATGLTWTGSGTDGIAYGLEIQESTAVAYEIDALGSSYSITGTDATFSQDYNISANGGSYAISGSAVELAFAKEIAANGGSYSITGQAATLAKGLILALEEGTYSLTGGDVTFTQSCVVEADGGSYVITGTAANLERHREVAAVGGSYSISGVDVDFLSGFLISAVAGTYTISGAAASLEFNREVAANGGSYSISGQDAGLTVGNDVIILAEQGNYLITGGDVTLQSVQVGNTDALRPSLISPLRDPLNSPFPHERFN